MVNFCGILYFFENKNRIFLMKVKVVSYRQNKNILYRVQSGENLDDISKKFNVSKNYIATYNGKQIYAGLVIFLPEANFKTYTVQPFDTLEKIAELCNVSVQEIIQKNGLQNQYVFVGQKLFV